MTGDKLTLDYNSDERTVWLILTSTSGLQHKKLIWLRDGFGIDDVCEAIMATGWVRQLGDELRLTSDMGCEPLCDFVEAMLGYFEAPGVPSSELLKIQSAVSEFDPVRELRRTIPLYAYAWLDVMVREDLADEARSGNRIWLNSNVVIDVARHCERRVAELVMRYSQRPASSTIGSMAPSMPTRQANESRARLG